MTEMTLFGDEETVQSDGDPARSAVLSDCGTYRYELRRAWGPSLRTMIFVMLNPSVADALVDDHTVRRCVFYASREGCGRLLVVNLYALRSTDPAALWAHPDPIGPDNGRHLAAALEAGRVAGLPIVAAWGCNAPAGRVEELVEAQRAAGTPPLLCLGTTGKGAPRHPSRLGNDVPLVRWG